MKNPTSDNSIKHKRINKVNRLSVNLKKEIFSFLPVHQLLNGIVATSKSNKNLIFDYPFIGFIKSNFEYLIKHITFLEEDLHLIKDKMKSILEISEAIANEVCFYLLLRKYSKSSILNLSPNCRQDSDPKDFYLLSKFISNENIELKELNLYDNKIGENQHDLNLLADAISKNKTIESLILGKNLLGNPDLNLALFAQALANNKAIKILRLDENDFVDNQLGVKILFEQLKENDSIVSLHLENNKLGKDNKSMIHISAYLKLNSTLKNLDLSLNNLGINPDNLLYLTNGLESNKTLESLDLNTNEFGKYNESRQLNGVLLGNILAKNWNLKQLNLSKNDFKQDDLIINKIQEAIDINKTNREIYLFSNSLGVEQKNLINAINLKYPFIKIKF